MPYSVPSLPVSYDHDHTSHADERGPGAVICQASPPHDNALPVVFHYPDNDLPHNSHSQPYNHSPSHVPVPFPRFSPLSPETNPSFPTPSPLTQPRRSRTSSPTLQNDQPLKSSLKSPSPGISIHPLHRRARSAPSTPKNVHFPEKDRGLETFRIFSHSAKPSSLSNTNASDDTETETESESTNPFSHYFANTDSTVSRLPSSSPHVPHLAPNTLYDLDLTRTSRIPAPSPPTHANIYLESLSLSPHSLSVSTAPKWGPALAGTIVVRNMAYEKDVAVRFTLDDWQTTNEVFAWHVASLPHLPLQLLPTPQGNAITAERTSEIQKEKKEAGIWDRFAFIIHLKDRAFKLHQRVLWLAARFAAGGGEWWDNNSGENYRVCFREVAAIPVPVPTSRSAAVNTGARVGVPGARPPSPPAPPVRSSPHAFQLTAKHLPIAARPSQSPTAFATMQRLSKFNLRNYAAPATAGSAKREDVDPDSMYKAFVRQWCFEQGPPPAVGGNVGSVVEGGRELFL